MLKALPWLGLALLTGCGGKTGSTPPEPEATGGASPSAGTSSGGAPVTGSSSDGGGDEAGRSSSGASGGVGGKLPDFPAGAPNNPLACSASYAGPSGGPRVDGPMPLGSCQNIPDDVVLARYQDSAARVPQGLYYEPSESITFWKEPCANSPEETVNRGPTDGLGTFVKSYSSEWFYEAVYCIDNSLRRIERNLRCDYFDGTKLAMPSTERLAFLASLIWWGHSNSDGVVLGYSVSIGDATDVVDLCTISSVHGDFGLCDEVHLEDTRHRLMFDGSVVLGTPEVIRTLKGQCH